MIHGFYTFYINKINLLQNETVITDLLYHRTGSKGRRKEQVRMGRFLRLTGPPGRRVLRFDGPCGPEGCGGGCAAVLSPLPLEEGGAVGDGG
jgi:hypothetical protein